MPYATTATTRLDAIRHNLDGVRGRVGSRLVLAAVKANAYGHGAVEVSRMIEASGCADWLGVATVDEGVELRRAGVGLPILKLSHCVSRDEIDAALAGGLVLPVVDAATIDAVGAAATASGRDVDVHLKVDTGMGRIGCAPADAPGLARRVDATPGLRLQGVYSHLPIADSPAGFAFTREQIGVFSAMVDAVATARGRPELVHLANSGAVLQHPDAWFDLVRPGIMIYGSYPDAAVQQTVRLEPALRWTTRVSFVKRVTEGVTIGYGRTWTAPRETTIATVPVGYGDGYSRLLSNRGRVLIGGRAFPIVGRVCMDQTMIDVGDADVTAGDEVVLIGRSGAEEITVSEVGDLMGTIPYEVTCLIAGRVTRATVDAEG